MEREVVLFPDLDYHEIIGGVKPPKHLRIVSRQRLPLAVIRYWSAIEVTGKFDRRTKSLRKLLGEYISRIKSKTNGYGFVVTFAGFGPRKDKATTIPQTGLPMVSTKVKFMSKTDAVEEAIKKIQKNANDYISSDVKKIQLKTIHTPGRFLGPTNDITDTYWHVVKYNAKHNCVLMALLLGKRKHEKMMVRGIPILATNKKVWQHKVNNLKSKQGKLFRQYEEIGKSIPNGCTSDDIQQLAEFMELTVVQYDSQFIERNTYGTGPRVNVLVHAGHCELMIPKKHLSSLESRRLNFIPKNYVRKRRKDTGYGNIMAACISSATVNSKCVPFAIGSKLLRGKSNYIYSVDCLSEWFKYLSHFSPIYHHPRWAAENPRRIKLLRIQHGVAMNRYLGDQYDTIYIYVHNYKGYDFFMLRMALINSLILVIDDTREISNGSKMITFTVRNARGMKFVFLDSFLLIPQQLSELTKEFNITYKNVHQPEDINQYFIENGYHQNSIESLHWENTLISMVDSLFNVLVSLADDALLYNTDITKSVSLTHLCKNIYRTNFMKYRIENLSDIVDTFIEPAVMGGDCQPSYLGVYDGPAWFYDVNSLYPSICMNHNLLPTETIGDIITCDIDLKTVEDFDTHFDTLSFMEVLVISNTQGIENRIAFHLLKLPHDDTIVNLKPVIKKWTKMTRYSKEIRYGLELQSYHYKVLKYQKFMGRDCFHDYMTAFTDKKKLHKERNNHILSDFYKLSANGLHGATAMKVKDRVGVQLYGRDKIQSLMNKIAIGEILDFQMINSEYASVHQSTNIKKTFFNRAIYAAVCSEGRIIMDRFERWIISRGGKVLYGDTDSKLTNIDCTEYKGIGNEIGDWSNELPGNTPYTTVCIGGCKSYLLHAEGDYKNATKIAQRGFTGKPTINEFLAFMESGTLIEPQENVHFRAGVKASMNGCELKATTNKPKSFTIFTNKGRIENGWVTPYDLDTKIQ